ncbi:MAG: sulfatase [Planctomycetota bacterium]
MRFLAAVTLAAWAVGCSDRGHETPSLIRWTDPAWIGSVETEHRDLNEGILKVYLKEAVPFSVQDHKAEWYPFHPDSEFGDNGSKPGGWDPAKRTKLKSAGLLIRASSGVAFWQPIKEEPHPWVLVKFAGRFNPDAVHAVVYQLSSEPPLPETYSPGVLREAITPLILANHTLTVDREGSFTSGYFHLNPKTRGLLFTCSVGKHQEVLLESVKFYHLGAEEVWILERQKRIPDHPALDPKIYIGGTVRPSLFIPPRTTISLKEVEMGEGGEFRCALGVHLGLPEPVEVIVRARDDDDAFHEVVKKRLDPGIKDWIPIERDLSHLAGQRVKFILTCDWVEDRPHKRPPFVFCGSPALYFEEPESRDPRLNLILISLDTLRRDHLGCYGYERPVSPNMDRLAAENLLLTQVYSQAPYTLPSHVSLFTSLYPSTHGVERQADRLPNRVELLSEILQREGWSTASFSGGGFMSHHYGYYRGHDIYCEVDPLGDRYHDWIPREWPKFGDGSTGSFRKALDWMSSTKDRPFYLFLHTFMVHEYLPPLDLADQFNVDCTSDLEPSRKTRIIFTQNYFQEHGVSPENLKFFINLYDATIRAADDMIGELIDHLKHLGIYDRTLIVITSDHGEEFLEHDGILHTRTVYEELIQVPLIMRVPGIAGGRKIDTVLNQVDIMPTLLQLLGIPAPGAAQGRSFAAILRGAKERDRIVFAEVNLPGNTRRVCLIQDGWKYMEGDSDARLKYPAPYSEELYRLTEDSGEQRNMIGEQVDVEEKLKVRMHRFKGELEKTGEIIQAGDDDSSPLSAEVKKMLEEQGYL